MRTSVTRRSWSLVRARHRFATLSFGVTLAARLHVRKWWVALGAVVVVSAVSRCGPLDLCDGDSQAPCTSKPVPGTHTIDVSSGFCGGCIAQCETGWLDCDNDVTNGCETPGTKCSSQLGDGGMPPTATLLATLSGAPHGVAVCGTNVFYFDDADLLQFVPDGAPKKVATSPSTPKDGLACDGTFLYWAAGDTIWELPIWATSATALATGVDPGTGVDLRGASVYFVEHTDAGATLAHTTGDAGWTAIMPITETGVYKPFALTQAGDYSIDQGTIWFNAPNQDAGGPVQIATMTNALALFAGSSPTPYVIAASTGSDSLSQVVTDAASVPIPTIVAVAAAQTKAVLISDDSVYAFDLQKNKLTTLVQPALHGVHVATDGTTAYWTTRGEGLTLGAVWTMPLP